MNVFFDVMEKAIRGSQTKEYLLSVVGIFSLAECEDLSWLDEVDYIVNTFPNNGVEMERAELLRIADARLADLSI
jgi:hypothetical protein